MATSARTQRVSRIGTILVVAVPILVLHINDWWRLIPRWWSDPNYTHGFFVPLFSLYFVWEKWERLSAIEPRPSLIGLPVLLLGLSIKMGTLFYDSLFISCSSMVFVISGAVLLVGGIRLFRAAAVPILFLFLMMPLPQPLYERIALPLQSLAATVSTAVLQSVGILAWRQGNVVHLPSRSLEVIDACSGMRFLTGFIALGVAFAYLCRRPLWERVVLVLSTIPIAILANTCRVTVTAFLAHWGFDSFVDGTPHEAIALVLFAFSALLLWAELYILSHLFLAQDTSEGDR